MQPPEDCFLFPSFRSSPFNSTYPTTPSKAPRSQRGGGSYRASFWLLLWYSPMTHLSLDVRSNAEEQGPVERQFNHVVPILGRDDALREKRGSLTDPRATGPSGLTSPNPALLALKINTMTAVPSATCLRSTLTRMCMSQSYPTLILTPHND